MAEADAIVAARDLCLSVIREEYSGALSTWRCTAGDIAGHVHLGGTAVRIADRNAIAGNCVDGIAAAVSSETVSCNEGHGAVGAKEVRLSVAAEENSCGSAAERRSAAVAAAVHAVEHAAGSAQRDIVADADAVDRLAAPNCGQRVACRERYGVASGKTQLAVCRQIDRVARSRDPDTGSGRIDRSRTINRRLLV